MNKGGRGWVQESESGLELELESELELELVPDLELELEDKHGSNVVREPASESDPEPDPGRFKNPAAPSVYGWSVDNMRDFSVFTP